MIVHVLLQLLYDLLFTLLFRFRRDGSIAGCHPGHHTEFVEDLLISLSIPESIINKTVKELVHLSVLCIFL